MEWFIAVVVIAVLGVAAVAASGGLGEMSKEPVRDLYRQDLPADRPLAAPDINRLRFGVTLRGYAMGQVDDVLDRLAGEIAERDALIARLRADAPGSPTPPDIPDPDTVPPGFPDPNTLPPDLPDPGTLPPELPEPDTLPPDLPRPGTLPPDLPRPGTMPPDIPEPGTLPLDVPDGGAPGPEAPQPSIAPAELPAQDAGLDNGARQPGQVRVDSA